jgi:hypothetical protein
LADRWVVSWASRTAAKMAVCWDDAMAESLAGLTDDCWDDDLVSSSALNLEWTSAEKLAAGSVPPTEALLALLKALRSVLVKGPRLESL